MTDPKSAQPDDDEERTTVVDRTGRSSLVPDDEHEGTVVVDRSVPAADEHEGTVVVDRSVPAADEHEGTVVVDRSVPAADEHEGTVVVDRSVPAADEHDGTVVVPRPASEKSKSASRPADSPRRGRRRITLPPVEPGFGPDPVDAVGAGAVDAYQPRTIEPAPALAPQVPLGAEATRAPAPSMPSVRRRSAAFGAIAIGGFALACVISVAGLVLIVTALLS
jgi:hypothetical protein